jgi:hypothetical protein
MLSGAFGVTLFGIFLTPVFFYVVEWLSGRGRVKDDSRTSPNPGRDQ